ncbi:MAG: gliding motility-associated C-terminal domain-containing protein [Bacteroidia bacterium]|nr:gliding motility-associated C-terminal domain-containing protein [Bacteroidia bacterium]
MKNILTAIAILCYLQTAVAQPSNDNCAFAQLITLPATGSLCLNSTNASATPDGVTPNTCNAPTGGNEVWYSFITTGTQNTITALPIAPGPASSLVISVPNGNCNSNTSLVCNAAISPGGPASVNFAVPVGTQVWFEVSSLGASGSFNLCVTSITPVPNYAAGIGDSCATSIRLCNKQSFTGNPPPIFSNSGQQISCYTFPAAYLSDVWYKFTVAKSGTFEFLCTPQVGLDIDWEVLNVTAGCAGAPVVACNYTYNGAGGDPTGLSASVGSPCGGAAHICTAINVTAGNTYAIHLNYTNPSLNTFDMSFGGTFQIAPYPDFYVDAPGGCFPHTTDFTDSSYAGTTYNWSFGNGNTFVGNNPPQQNYPLAGNYVVGLVLSHAATGCTNATSRLIQVGAGPSSTFTTSQATICVGLNDTINYTGNGGPLATFNWNFNGATIVSGSGSGPYIVQWNTSGTKTVTLTVTENGCQSNPTNVNVTVNDPPTSTFSMPASGCVGDTIMIAYNGNAASTALYYWSLGNSFIAGGNNIDTFLVTWGAAGLDSVYLIIDQLGCISNTTTQYITLGTKPISTFSLTDSICSSAQAIATYTGTSTGTAQYDWDFGSGTAAPGGTVAGPQNIGFSASGYQVITLVVNEAGCLSNKTTDSVYVTQAPTSTFTISDDSLCGNENTIITYTGSGSSTATYNYNFGSATISSGSGSGPYDINYVSTGMQYITLTVFENGCNSVLFTDSIIIAANANANAGTDVTICNGDSVQIGDISSVGYSYSWMPANSVNNAAISNPYAVLSNNTSAPSTTNLIVTALNNFCSDKDTVAVTVEPRQKVNIAVTPGISQCLDVNNFNFSNNATAVTGSTYSWNFTPAANTTTATTANVSGITYTTAGTYLITLTATTGSCPALTDTQSIYVNDAATANFMQDDSIGCPPFTATFTDLSTAVAAGSSYLWTFGNGNTSTLVNPPAQTYTSAGQYTVSLAITSLSGCVSTKTKTNLIKVVDVPVASFIADPKETSILQPVITFTSTSTNTDSCFYNFGDGGTANACFISHDYTDTGTYVVTLVVTNSGGCSDSTTQTVVINDYYTLYVPNAFSPNGDAINDYFSVAGFGVRDFKMKIFNRHGQLIYNTSNMNFAWDGKDDNGNTVQEGNYVYELEVKDNKNKLHINKGSIRIIL